MSKKNTIVKTSRSSAEDIKLVTASDILENSDNLVHNQVDIMNKEFEMLSRSVAKIFDRNKQEEVHLCQGSRANG